MFNKSDITRNEGQLFGGQAKKGYDWWWHSFTGVHAVTGEESSFFVEFFTVNPAYGGKVPVWGGRGEKPSYLMVKAGCWGENGKCQLHNFYGWEEVTLRAKAPFLVEVGECSLSETHMKGRVVVTPEQAADERYMCDGGEMSFDLAIHKKVAFNVGYGAGKLLRKLQLFEMFWHAEGMKTEYEGEVIVNGEKYLVTPQTSFGYADKNWGKDFTSPWVWLSSCDIVSECTGQRLADSVFDIGGGCPKVGGISLPRQLLCAFWREGKGYEFNFSKFWTGCRTKFSCSETEKEIVWHVEQSTWRNRMVTDITCRKQDMLLVNYRSPDGEKRHNRLWNGGTGKGTVSLYHNGKLIDKMRVSHVGCEYGVYTN